MTTFLPSQAIATEHTTAAEASHVLWHFDQRAGAMEPGSFTRSLLETIGRADPINRARLAAGFPGYVAAYLLGELGGFDTLREIAGIELCETCVGTGMRRADPPVIEHGAVRHLIVCPECRGAGGVSL